METIIGEWNTVVRLQDNLWLKIEEPRDETESTECSVTVHYSNPNIGNSDGDKPDAEDSLDIDYDYHKDEYLEQQDVHEDDD